MEEGTLMFVIAFPRPWPPGTCSAIFSHNGFGIKLSADAEGRLIFERSASGDIQSHLFQPIRIEGAGRAIVGVRWDPQNGVHLRINDVDVLTEEDAQGEALILRTKPEPLPTRGLIVGEIDLAAVRDNTERFFLETIMDIDQKLHSSNPYRIIRAAGLLRQLFLDLHPLVTVVNRTHRVKLQFETIDYRQALSYPWEIDWIELDANAFPQAERINNDLKDFLQAPCLKSGGSTFTVRDVIDACANAKGGVHLGNPKTVQQAAIIDWDRAVKQFGREPSLEALVGICRVSLRALMPLVDAIRNSENP